MKILLSSVVFLICIQAKLNVRQTSNEQVYKTIGINQPADIMADTTKRPVNANKSKTSGAVQTSGQQPAIQKTLLPGCCDSLPGCDSRCPEYLKTKNGVKATTSNNNIKDPFNPGSPDDDVRNPFDSVKKVKPAVIQPATGNQNKGSKPKRKQ